jgi:sugar phosphate isomerase/epimerase
MLTRRDFGKGTFAALSVSAMPARAAAPIEMTVRGVRVGLGTSSLNPLPAEPGKDQTDIVIEQCLAVGAGNIEYYASFGPPLKDAGVGARVPAKITPDYERTREELRQWRLTVPLDYFVNVRKKFDAAGLKLFSYLLTFSDDFTDPEIDAVFRHMKAMGVDLFCTNQTTVSMGPRLVPFAEKYRIRPAFHTHAMVDDPNEVAAPESLRKLMALSPMFMVNLDIGHFVAGNNDPVAYLREHHGRITHIHVKDRKRNQGANLPWGEGETPIKECLTLIRDQKYPIVAVIEREYRGGGTGLEESQKCYAYMKRMLLS